MYKFRDPTPVHDINTLFKKATSKKKREPFWGDTCNSLAKIVKDFHLSRLFGWYSKLRTKEKRSNRLWTVELVKVGCMPKVFIVPELVFWCSKCFDPTKRVIHIGEIGFPPISLSPLVFSEYVEVTET